MLHPAVPPVCARVLGWCARRPRRAVALAARLIARAPDARARGWAELVVVWSRLGEGQPVAAEAALARAAAGLQGDAVGELYVRHARLYAAYLRSAEAARHADWTALIADLTAHGCHGEASQARVTQLRHLNMLGRPHEVIAAAPAVRAHVERTGGPIERAMLERAVAIARLELNALDAAERGLAEAERAFRRLRHPVELARVWMEQGRLGLQREQFAVALDCHQRALALVARLGHIALVALCQRTIGFVEAKLGRADRAIAALLAARADLLTLGMRVAAADCDLNLGNVAYHSGLFNLALATWRRAEPSFAAAGLHIPSLIARRNQAEALFQLGRLAEAGALLDELLPISVKLGARRDRAEILQLQGELRLAQGELPAARAALLAAAEQFAALGNLPGAARARLALGRLQLAAGDLAGAAASFERAADDLAERQQYRWRALYGLGRCAELRGEPLVALAFYTRACDDVARLRAALAEEHASSALFAEAAELTAATIRLAADHAPAEALLGLAEQQRGLALQRQLRRATIVLPPALAADVEARRDRLRELLAQGAHGAPVDAALDDYLELLLHGRHAVLDAPTAPAAPAGLAELRAALGARLGERWTALVYVQHGTTLLAVVIEPDRAWHAPIALDAELRLLLDRACLPAYRAFTLHDLPFAAGRHASPWADLARLGERLLPEALRARLAPEHRLLIAPGGPLHSLPWAALRLDGRWLAEQATVQIIPSLQIWHELARRPVPGDEALLLAIGQFDGRARPLPSALPSLELVQRHWPGAARRLEHDAATRTALRSAAAAGELRRYGLLHLATHAQLTAGRGALAHITLADDAMLADEVAQLNLGGALVVLAACEGALGETLPGEELISLSWAFLAAGARDVIASLWQLRDRALLPVLEPLYAALAGGADPPTALAAAQRACIDAGRRRPGELLGSPYVWAGLCAIGAG